MCFSAVASFAAGGGLLVAGALALRSVWPSRPAWVPLALLPVGFAVQQLCEGAVWLALAGPDPAAVRAPALGFVFFSHGFWLLWVPLAVALIEPVKVRRRAFAALAVAGLALGALLYGSILQPDALHVEILHHSIRYHVALISDGVVPRPLLDAAYAAIITIPLLGTSHHRVRTFGAMITASLIVSLGVFLYAFASVWCFFAAILSSYIVWAVRSDPNAVP